MARAEELQEEAMQRMKEEEVFQLKMGQLRAWEKKRCRKSKVAKICPPFPVYMFRNKATDGTKPDLSL